MRNPQNLRFISLLAILGFMLLPISMGHAAKASELNGAVKTELVNVNRASQVELESIRGIGPALAERIVKYRESNGSFKSVEDLSKVSGIGESKLAKIKSQITV